MKRTRAPRTPVAKPATTAAITTPNETPTAPQAPVDKRVKVTCWIRESIATAMKHEGIDRKMSFGELVEEAMQARTLIVRR